MLGQPPFSTSPRAAAGKVGVEATLGAHSDLREPAFPQSLSLSPLCRTATCITFRTERKQSCKKKKPSS